MVLLIDAVGYMNCYVSATVLFYTFKVIISLIVCSRNSRLIIKLVAVRLNSVCFSLGGAGTKSFCKKM